MRSSILVALASVADAQLLAGAGNLGGGACTMTSFTARTDEVDSLCCNAANSAADRCINGVPQRCDSTCAGVYIPWYTECMDIITTIVDEHQPIYEDVLEMCQAGDAATLFTEIHDITLDNECRVHLPHTPIAPGCFDVGCSIGGNDLPNGMIDGVASAAACQELCAEEPECFFFVFRTDGHVAAATGQSLQSVGGNDGQCRLKGIHSQAGIQPQQDGFPGVCGPKTCNEVVEETFHWDASTGFLGWQVLGPGVTGYATSNNGNAETAAHTYRAYDCVGNCEEGAEDSGWGNGKIWGLVPWPWETRDHANELLYVRSPPFSNPVRIEFDLMGGSGTVTGRHPTNENNVPVGYLGVCVRSVRDGSYTHCVNLDCGTAANGWTDGTITCDNRAGDSGWQSTGVHNWNHMVIDCGPFVTNTVEQYTLEIVDNYGGGPWAHLEMQDVVIEAALADETPNIFYSRSLTALEPMVTIDSASGSSCTSTGAPCEVSGNIRPSQGAEPAPFGLQGYTFMQGDDVHLNAPSGVMIDGTWTVDCFIQTPFPCTNCETHVASGWHTLVRGQDQDHPVLLWSEDESTIGAYDNSDRRNADGSSAEFYPTTFKMSELADGWHRLTVTGAEDITSYFIDGEKVGEVYFVATRDIYQVGNAPSLTQPWGDLAGFMLFDEALSPGQVKALYHGACIAGGVCGARQPGCTAGLKQLSCQEDAEQTSGLAIGDQVEHQWDSMLQDFCHSEPTVGAYGAVTNVDPPDPMLARGTVCGFDGSLVLIHWDMVQNTNPSCGAEQVHRWCESDGTWCRNGQPFWTRLRDGVARDSGWIERYLGDAATGTGGQERTSLCGISPTRAELKSALPPFTLEKITCNQYGGNVAAGGGHDVMDGDCVPDPTWTPPILGGRPITGNQPGGGHRRQMDTDDTTVEATLPQPVLVQPSEPVLAPEPVSAPAPVAEEPVEEPKEVEQYSVFRALQAAMGVDPSRAGKAAHKAHVGLQDFDSDVCSVDTIGDLAEAVDADCCYQNGVYKCSATAPVPETCSYACGVVMVPFYENCGDILTNLFGSQLTALTELYDSCLNADSRVLTTAYDQRECCTPENCNGCQSADSCSALPGNTCQWGPSATIGRQVDSRCNCVGTGPGPYGSVAQEANAFPDYASCHAACLATAGCNFFGVWDASPSDNAYPDYCRMWDTCETCEHAVHSNTVWQAHDEYELTAPGLTWNEAHHFCQSHGGHLVSIHSDEDFEHVWAVARGNRVWIGLNDQVTTDVRGRTTGSEGTWVWTDGSPTDYLHWNAAQPDNADAAGGLHLDGSAVEDPTVEHEDCVEMYSGYDGEWNDRMCSDAGYGICHFPVGRGNTSPPLEECFPNPSADAKYVRVDQRMQQSEARDYCRAHFYDLASIHTVQENDAVLLACISAGASAIIGDWVDQTGSFYQGSTISITEGGWTVTPPSYTDGDTLSLEKIGDAYSLTEHDGTRLDGTITDNAADYHHMTRLNPDGTLRVTEERMGHREWTLTRVSAAPQLDADHGNCVVGAVNTGPGHTWEWTDGSDMNFQYWSDSDGDVASNAGRVAAARIGHDLHGMEDASGQIRDGGHWDDGPADDPGHYFICERYP